VRPHWNTAYSFGPQSESKDEKFKNGERVLGWTSLKLIKATKKNARSGNTGETSR